MKNKILILVLLFLIYFFQQLAWFNQTDWRVSSGYSKIPSDHLPSTPINPDLPNIRWLGHSSFLIFWGDKRVLLDPILSENCSIIHRSFKSFIKPNELPEIDAALISHAHYDHLDLATLEEITALRNVVLPSGSEEYLSEKILRKSKIIGIQIDQAIKLGNLEIIQVPAFHNGARNHPFKSEHFATGYIIRDDKYAIYYSGDTGYGEHFKKIRERFSPNISILPIGSFEPYFVLKHYHLNPEDALRAALDLKSELIVPAHFGTFRLALDSLDTALPRFAKLAKEKGAVWELKPNL